MINIHINDTKLAEDIEMAKSIINGKIMFSRYAFHTCSKIFNVTNESLSHEAFKNASMDRRRVLSITASGDHIINSILYGGKEFIGIDISAFPKYFVALKLAALKLLSQDEYLLFILGNDDIPPLSINLYEKVRESLDEISKAFWDTLFNSFSDQKTKLNKLFFKNIFEKNMIINFNPYLQDDNFKRVKDKIENVHIDFHDKDIFELSKSDFGEFDLILLSNVLDYFYNVSGAFISKTERAEDYLEFFRGLPLKKDGVAVAYNMIMNGFTSLLLIESNIGVNIVSNPFDREEIESEIITYLKKR